MEQPPRQDMVLLAGSPGSGKSRLGGALAERLSPYYQLVEHLSLGDQVRRIGHHAVVSAYSEQVLQHLKAEPVKPLPDAVAGGIVNETLHQPRTGISRLVLLDGYPRYRSQVKDVMALSTQRQLQIRLLLYVMLPRDIALQRLTHRHHGRSVDEATANQRLDDFAQASEPMLQAVSQQGIPIEQRSSAGEKNIITDQATQLLHAYLRLGQVAAARS